MVGERTYLRAPQPRDWEAWAALRAASRDFLVPWEPTWPHDALTRAAFRRRLRQVSGLWPGVEAEPQQRGLLLRPCAPSVLSWLERHTR